MQSQVLANRIRLVVGLIVVIPFLGMGLFVAFIGINEFSKGSDDPTALIPLGMGIIFSLIAVAIASAAVKQFKKLRQIEAIQREHPDEPWLWTDKWKSGRIETSSGRGIVILWILALGALGLGIFLGTRVASASGDERIAMLIFAIGLSVVGLAFGAGAAYTTRKHLKYGRSYCDLVTNPGVVGGWFKCAIRARLPLDPHDKLTVKLSNIHKYVTGTGKNRSTKRKILWQEIQEIPPDKIHREPGGWTTIPVVFYLPRDGKATTTVNPSNRHLWELDVEADVPGVNFSAKYEVPAYVTPESSDTVPEEASDEQMLTPEQAKDFTETSLVRISAAQGGGTEIYLPPARNKGAALVLTVFTLIWTGVVVFMVAAGAPIFFTLIFGLFDAVLIYASLSMWFGTTRTLLQGDTITVHNSTLGMGSPKEVAKGDITDVTIDQGMKSGDHVYYRVHLCTDGKQKYAIAKGIPEKNEARWLANIVRTYLEAE